MMDHMIHIYVIDNVFRGQSEYTLCIFQADFVQLDEVGARPLL